MKPSLAFLPFCLAGFLSVNESAHAISFTIDNGGTGYSTTGSWSTQGGFDASYQRFNGDWQYQNTGGSGTDSATYNFTSLPAGKYLVSAATAWGGQANLTTGASYAGTDGFSTYSLNQAVGQRDFDTSAGVGYGVGFARLGTVPVLINDGTFQITVTNGAGANFLTADAIRLELVAPDVDKVFVIDNDEPAGYSESGTWNGFGNENEHDSGFRYGNGSAMFTFNGLTPGTYRISSTWTGGGNRDANVTASYTTAGGSGSLAINQQASPSGATFEEVPWDTLFNTVTVTGTTLSVSLTGSGSGFVIGDAVRLELLSVPEPSSMSLIGVVVFGLFRRRRI